MLVVVQHYLTAVALLGNSFWSEIMKSSKKGLGLEYKATKLHNSNFGHVVVEVSWTALQWRNSLDHALSAFPCQA